MGYEPIQSRLFVAANEVVVLELPTDLPTGLPTESPTGLPRDIMHTFCTHSHFVKRINFDAHIAPTSSGYRYALNVDIPLACYCNSGLVFSEGDSWLDR